ncbi:Putative uncharacterized protein [Moritella viscosa]|uniref:Uncharacterized protein n=1 Tax=Moritella viscosa TaxID=80854 RepID=A0A1K9Z2B5_9GAMM|nr:Putative uncharacterized protein [Moritella viscosa]SGY97468.1 Putative uncharacterized protein [Moritella viscosa]SGY97585.1 Putative uncharacterized protein [Moritella viscosa]SHO04763.1 Putative uncharacterized protein [Moritella viscosa]SHO04769.1 Putative uncharacterized protein [Moritella viscosa]
MQSINFDLLLYMIVVNPIYPYLPALVIAVTLVPVILFG